MANLCCVCGERIGRNQKYYQLNKSYPDEHLCPSCAAGMQRVYQCASTGDTDFRSEMRGFVDVLRSGKADETAMEYLDHFLDGCNRMYRAQLSAEAAPAQGKPSVAEEPVAARPEPAAARPEPAAARPEPAPAYQEAPEPRPEAAGDKPAAPAVSAGEETAATASVRIKRVQAEPVSPQPPKAVPMPPSGETIPAAVVSTPESRPLWTENRPQEKPEARPHVQEEAISLLEDSEQSEEGQEKKSGIGLFGRFGKQRPVSDSEDDESEEEDLEPGDEGEDASEGLLGGGKGRFPKRSRSAQRSRQDEDDENDEDDEDDDEENDGGSRKKDALADGTSLLKMSGWILAAVSLLGGAAIGYNTGKLGLMIIGILCGGGVGLAAAAWTRTLADAAAELRRIRTLLEKKDSSEEAYSAENHF